MKDKLKVLLIEDNPADIKFIKVLLGEMIETPRTNILFELECRDTLTKGLEFVKNNDTDVILLDLSLPESNGFKTFSIAHSAVPDIPIVVLTGVEDETLASKLVHEGAQDYIVKGNVDSTLLFHSLYYAYERYNILKSTSTKSFFDQLTGLYNRYGFLTLAQQQLKISSRRKNKLLLFYMDIDGFKQVNDTFGYNEGDMMLKRFSGILKNTFRKSDIIARIGGDEFVVMAIETQEYHVETFKERMNEQLKISNSKIKTSYKLNFSLGVVCYSPENPCNINELLVEADSLMYVDKQKKNHLSEII